MAAAELTEVKTVYEQRIRTIEEERVEQVALLERELENTKTKLGSETQKLQSVTTELQLTVQKNEYMQTKLAEVQN